MAKPKLSDVAALAGVSPTTVSRVLNNRGYLSEATRTKVHEAVQQLGYRPNAIARSLQGRTESFSAIVKTTLSRRNAISICSSPTRWTASLAAPIQTRS